MNNDFIATRFNVRPWEEIQAAIGTSGTASTRRGNRVNVWRPDAGVTDTFSYWCHGHALGTYPALNFTPFSGVDAATILADEYTRIFKKPQAGDVIVFRDINDVIQHTARVIRATPSFGGRTAIRLSSKNGSNRLLPDTSIEAVMREYNTCYWFKTTQTCCNTSEERTDKQYYRPNL